MRIQQAANRPSARLSCIHCYRQQGMSQEVVEQYCSQSEKQWCDLLTEDGMPSQQVFCSDRRHVSCHDFYPELKKTCGVSNEERETGLRSAPLTTIVDDGSCPTGQRQKRDGSGCEPIPPVANVAEQALRECEQAQVSTGSACQAGPGIVTNPSCNTIECMCRQFEQNNLASSQDFAAFGNQCNDAARTCQVKCDRAKTASASDPGRLSRANDLIQQCSLHGQKAQLAQRQGLQSMSTAQRSQECAKLAAANNRPPNQGPGPNPGSGPGPSSGPTTQSTDPNKKTQQNQPGDGTGSGGMPSLGGGSQPTSASSPNSPYNSFANNSQVQRPQAEDTPGSQGGFRDAEEKTDEKNFNVNGDTQQNSAFQGNGEQGGPKFPGGPGQQKTVANNSGGSIPGGDGGPGARFLPPTRAGGPAPNSNVADILKGFQGGGGGSAAAASGGSGFDDSNNGFKGYGGDQGRGPASDGIDLRKYLPGGTHDPHRRAGGFRPFSLMDINSAHTNIFNKVGDRLREKCKLGILFDCR